MATTYNKLLLDINEKPNDIITAVQNDTNSRYLDVLLYDNGVPINLDGCEVKIFMNKPEKGGEIWNNGVITDAENGRCEFLLTTEALTHFGHMQVQISIWKENVEILSTQIFEIIVTKSLLGNSSVEASNEYGTLVILFQNLYEAYDLMTRMVENIGVPAEVAAQYDLATMWQAWEFLVAYMKGDLTEKIDDVIANSSTQGVLDELENVKEILNPEHGVDIFDTSGTYTWICPSGVNTATIIIIGAGGGGAGGGGGYSGSTNNWTYAGGGGGGGGAGAIAVITLVVVPETEYKVVVGASGSAGIGGAAGNDGGSGGSGGKSQFDKIIAFGGSGGSGGVQAKSTGANGGGGSGGSGGNTIVIGSSGSGGSGGSSGSGSSSNGTSAGGSGGSGGAINSCYDISGDVGKGGSGGAGGKKATKGSNGSAGRDGAVYIIY